MCRCTTEIWSEEEREVPWVKRASRSISQLRCEICFGKRAASPRQPCTHFCGEHSPAMYCIAGTPTVLTGLWFW